MKVHIVSIGKTTESYLKEGIEAYRKRLKHYLKLEWTELPELKQTAGLSREQIMKREAELLQAKIRPGSFLLLLDENGTSMSSEGLAAFLNKRMLSGSKELTVLIGGAYGFGKELRQSAGAVISLSKMTFTHQMVRLIWLEQLYRAMSILRNEPYHHA